MRSPTVPRDQVVPASTDLRATLEEAGLEVSDEQLRLLDRFRDRYGAYLPGGENEMLWACCEDAKECWRGKEYARDTSRRRGGITLPWVGSGYEEQRVALLALNLRQAGGLVDELQLVGDTRRAFESNRERVHDSLFPYRSAAMIWAVLRALDREEVPTSPPQPRDLVSPLMQSARIQLVKCSPFDGGSSVPSSKMFHNCSDRFLRSDLEMLSPRVLLTVDTDVRGNAWRLLGIKWAAREVPGLSWGHFELAGDEVTVFCAYHPGARGNVWEKESWPRLREALNAGALSA